jgi:hypothetical protein
MTIKLQLTPEMETVLRQRAAAEGKDPAALALEAVAEKLAPPNGPVSQGTAADRLDAWNRFVAGMREHAKKLPSDHFVDDSRESIYEGRGE